MMDALLQSIANTKVPGQFIADLGLAVGSGGDNDAP
jgi:hypothetical protein